MHKQAQAYEADMGKPFERKLSPESQAVLDRYSGSSAAPAASSPGDMIHVQIPGQKPGTICAVPQKVLGSDGSCDLKDTCDFRAKGYMY